MTAGPPRLVVASANPAKIAELVDLLGGRYAVEPRPPKLADTVEDGDTLQANALKKAREVASFTGVAALADDTGLFVDALEGRPGVHTARYAGESATSEQNVARLLAELDGLGDPAGRSAAFATVIALVEPDGTSTVAQGRVAGRIASAPRGEGGFGYDPVFVPLEGDGRTFAEMTSDEKHRYSHRARALQALLHQLAAP